MRKKSWAMMKVLLNHFHQGSTEALQHCLPLEEMQIVLSQDLSSQKVEAALISHAGFFGKIHYSWIAPIILTFDPNIQPFIISALDLNQAAGLFRLLKIEPIQAPKSDLVKNFLLQQLHQRWETNEILPIAFLPETALSALLDLSKEELVELIDYLGLFDLSDKIRRIVDKNKLKDVYQCLTKKMQQFLNVCLRQKEKITAPEIKLETWKGDKESLMYVLHQRGLLRIGKALAGQSPDFQWHIAHVLDSGRGKVLNKYFSNQESPRVAQALSSQILSVLNYMKKKSES